MEPLPVNRDLVVPADALSVSYVRDLEDGGPEAARHTPTTVELRLELRSWPDLDDALRARILGYEEVKADRRGTIRVICCEHRSRARNLDGARQMLADLIARAVAPRDEPGDEGPGRRTPGAARRGSVLIKSRGRR